VISGSLCFDLDLYISLSPGAGIAVLYDTIYVCGGYDGTNHLASVESYNVRAAHWTQLANMTIPRCYVGAAVLKGKLYVVAG
jgi:kelch-like protein 12